ncbi:MAG: NPCBM/NEW2 domain-containing protein, partial [Micromonosporaceae bacterium]
PRGTGGAIRRQTVLAAAVTVLVCAVLAGSAEATRPVATAAPEVTVTAPDRIDQQRTVWDVGFGSVRGRTDPRTPDHVGRVAARIDVPETVRDVHVVPEGPGTFQATSATRWTVREPGTVTATWRWAAPLRVADPPDRLEIRVLVRYRDTSGVRTVSAAATVRTPPPPPPGSDTYVSELPYDFVSNGYGPPERDQNNGEIEPGDGGAIRLDGVTYEKGLGFNAQAVVGLHLAEHCTRFVATVGIDDAKGNAGTVVFRVLGDGRTLHDTGRMTGATPARSLDVDVSGVRRLALVSDPTADGQAHDWADWGGARLSCSAA